MSSSELEAKRLAALAELELLDTPPEERFERVTRIAKRHYNTRIALFTLVDAHRQWFKSRQGVTLTETPREIAFCDHTLGEDTALVVPDTLLDPRFRRHPLVKAPPHARFYAGIPVREPGGYKVGTLCVLDDRPRAANDVRLDVLHSLVGIVEAELRRGHRRPHNDVGIDQADLTQAIQRAQNAFATSTNRRSAFEMVLNDLLALSGSRFGLIGEAFRDAGGNPYLKIETIQHTDWRIEDETLYRSVRTHGLTINGDRNLLCAPLHDGRIVFSDNMALDPRGPGLPPGHPPVARYIGMPLTCGEQTLGLVGLGDRDHDYGPALAETLQPLLQTLGTLIERERLYREKHEHERDLELAAHYDALTGLPNRTRLAEMFERALTEVGSGDTLAVCMFDLDDFNNIDGEYGRATGDAVLRTVARRLRKTVPPDGLVGRVGGDEFVAILKNVDGDDAYERLLAAIRAPIIYRRTRVRLTASMGVTVYPHDDATVDLLLRHADQALYAAKELGKNRCERFDVARHISRKERLRVLDQAAAALADGQFALHYQPKIDLVNRRVAGFEALLRWHHPVEGVLAPAHFLSHLEYTDHAAAIGRFVLKQTIAQLRRFQRELPGVTISVNLSPSHFLSPTFCNDLWQTLRHCDPETRASLILELLETTALDDSDRVIETLQACREQGVQISLDDFGTGYSSLDYFRRLPAQEIKIDRSFVEDLNHSNEAEMIVKAIIGLATSFQRRIVAEGIEDAATQARLIELGCEYAQGFFYSPALPAEEALAWARAFTWPGDN